jgi:Rrf2 family protein
MKFSIKSQYGLQAMLELALKYGNEPSQIKDIARKQRIPIRFLEQLLLGLKRSGIVASTRGKLGGYNLAKHPSDITVLEIIESLEGPIDLVNVKLRRSPVLMAALEKIQAGFKAALKETTLEDLVLRKRQQDRTYTYNI